LVVVQDLASCGVWRYASGHSMGAYASAIAKAFSKGKACCDWNYGSSLEMITNRSGELL